ncbi:hypothetical protein CLF_100652 [Clonorchis sinensis]|uniref:Uncharacterized protein n=1 Tax=Clonorchis sinensis TaxID=79923 RepID=G7Y3Y0_CLOSI|nr:hypothetical protein CLF_100652 [Clonorchis sinensis]
MNHGQAIKLGTHSPYPHRDVVLRFVDSQAREHFRESVGFVMVVKIGRANRDKLELVSIEDAQWFVAVIQARQLHSHADVYGELSKSLRTQSNERQVYAHPPFLFNSVIDEIMRRTLESLQNAGVHMVSDENLVDPEYAHDFIAVFKEENYPLETQPRLCFAFSEDLLLRVTRRYCLLVTLTTHYVCTVAANKQKHNSARGLCMFQTFAWQTDGMYGYEGPSLIVELGYYVYLIRGTNSYSPVSELGIGKPYVEPTGHLTRNDYGAKMKAWVHTVTRKCIFLIWSMKYPGFINVDDLRTPDTIKIMHTSTHLKSSRPFIYLVSHKRLFPSAMQRHRDHCISFSTRSTSGRIRMNTIASSTLMLS